MIGVEVSFVLTSDDLRRVWQWARTPPMTLFVWMAAWLAAMTGLVAFLSHSALLSIRAAVLTSPAVIISWWVQSRHRGRRAADKALASDASLVGPRTLRLERAGIHDRRMAGVQIYPWSQVLGFHRHARYLLILVAQIGVIPVPLRAFASRKDSELFWTTLLAYKMSGGEAATAFAADETVWPPPPTPAAPQ
jgi:hypothetical protein